MRSQDVVTDGLLGQETHDAHGISKGRLTLKYAQRRFKRPFAQVVMFLAFIILGYSFCLAVFSPLYIDPPERYVELRQRVLSSSGFGRGNPQSRKVFIAANIVNAKAIAGYWGASVKRLIEILGPENTFLSIYENDSGPDTVQALELLRRSLPGNHSIVTGAHVLLDELRHIQTPSNGVAVSRLEYLAEVRNRALRPLQKETDVGDTGYRSATMEFDYVLFINDIVFDPIDAAQLLFSTGTSEGYDAACAVDFVSVTNYYDNFASRDSQGYGLGYGPGFRIFPWFAAVESAESRNAVLSGSDTVPVKSCWGGMTSFKGDLFEDVRPALRFRAEDEAFWDASECCLIHADILARKPNARIVQNPYVRVAYTETTFRWIWILARFEHGLAPLQRVLSWLNGYPEINERRTHEPGEIVDQKVFADGKYMTVRRAASPGGYCGTRRMELMRTDFATANMRGEKTFNSFAPP